MIVRLLVTILLFSFSAAHGDAWKFTPETYAPSKPQVGTCLFKFAKGGSVSDKFYPISKDACLWFFYFLNHYNLQNQVMDSKFQMIAPDKTINIYWLEFVNQTNVLKTGATCTLMGGEHVNLHAGKAEDYEGICRDYCRMVSANQKYEMNRPDCNLATYTETKDPFRTEKIEERIFRKISF